VRERGFAPESLLIAGKIELFDGYLQLPVHHSVEFAAIRRV
jgi:hypothetical protein